MKQGEIIRKYIYYYKKCIRPTYTHTHIYIHTHIHIYKHTHWRKERSLPNCFLWTGHLHQKDESSQWEYRLISAYSRLFADMSTLYGYKKKVYAAWCRISWHSCYSTERPAALSHSRAASPSPRARCPAGLWEWCRVNFYTSMQTITGKQAIQKSSCWDETARYASAQVTVQ